MAACACEEGAAAIEIALVREHDVVTEERKIIAVSVLLERALLALTDLVLDHKLPD